MKGFVRENPSGRIIQLMKCTREYIQEDQRNTYGSNQIMCLCDDGTIWMTSNELCWFKCVFDPNEKSRIDRDGGG